MSFVKSSTVPVCDAVIPTTTEHETKRLLTILLFLKSMNISIYHENLKNNQSDQIPLTMYTKTEQTKTKTIIFTRSGKLNVYTRETQLER
jgi:hypothetical protein